MAPPAVRISGVSKAFAGQLAVKDLTLEIARGSLFGLLGPNGAGKTTTLRMLLDIVAPDTGTIELLGGIQSARDRVGYMPEERGLYPRMVVEDQLLFFAQAKGTSRSRALARLPAWMERLGLHKRWRKRRLNELSKGMQQKVQFLATVLHDPELLILDEPMSGLDPVAATAMRDVLLELREQGKTLVLSSHQMETVERLCDTIALVNRGELLVTGAVAEVKGRGARKVVALGFEGDGAFLERLAGVVRVETRGDSVEVELRDSSDPQELLRAAAARLRVTRFEILGPSLHDVFLTLVGAHDARLEP